MEFKKLEKRVFIISAISFLLAAIFSTGYHHFDEHFQILEFAGLKLGLADAENLPWEYREQMRPAIQPALTVCLYQVLSFLGITDPFSFTLITRLLSAILSYFALFYTYQIFKNEFQQPLLKKWFLYFSFFLWLIVYNGVRFSSENWSELFFLFAFLLYYQSSDKKYTHFLIIGVFMGLSFLFRYQTALMSIGFTAWMLIVNKEKKSRLLLTSFGVLLMVGLGILIDKWFYDEWVLSPWNYFEQNLLLGKSKNFGVEPWYWYITQTFLEAIPPISLLMISGVMGYLLLYRKQAVTWIIFPFVLVHFVIGHKETRFLFPILFMVPYTIVKVLEFVNNKNGKFLNNSAFKFFMTIVLFTNYTFLFIVTFRPADNQIAMYKTLFLKYKEPTTLYYYKKNPYLRVLDINFYKQKQLKIVQIENLNKIPQDSTRKSLIVFTNRDNPENFEKKHKLIYNSFPNWVSNFNFNNWMGRSKSWYVYEL